MSTCSLDTRVKNAIIRTTSNMLTETGQFERVDQSTVKVIDKTSDYGISVMNVNNAFGEQVVKKLELKEKEFFDETLNNKLIDFAKSLNIDIKVISDLQKRLKDKNLNSDAVAVSDILHKAIFIDEVNFDSLILAEEVATFAIEFMGATKNPESSPIIRKLINNIQEYKDYQKYYDQYSNDPIYKGNEDKIKKEILSKAIAENIYKRKDKKENIKEQKTLSSFEKLINSFLELFNKLWKTDYYKSVDKWLKTKGINTKGVSQVSIRPFSALLNEITDDILFGNTKKFPIQKQGEVELNFKQLLEVNDNIRNLYNTLNSLGFMLTGSPSISQEGSIYRKDTESIHDLDWKVPPEMHENWQEKLKESFPNISIKINPISGKPQVFSKGGSTTNTFIINDTPIDFFIEDASITYSKNKYGNTRWQDTFDAKLDMARKKDISDLINFKTNSNDYFSNTKYLYYSIQPSDNLINTYLEAAPIQEQSSTAPIKEGVPELFESNPELANAVYEALGFKPISNNSVYSAVFFNTDEVTSKYKQVHPNLYSHHSTIQFKPSDISNLPIGNVRNIKIVGRLTTDKVDVLIVENPLSTNKFPHITLSTAEGVKPFESNSEIEKNQNKIQPINDVIQGTVGVFDGKSEITSLNLTLQQKQQAQQLYSQYLDTIFPDSKVKDIVYHGTTEKFENFIKEKINSKESTAHAKGFYFGWANKFGAAAPYAGNFGRGEKVMLTNKVEVRNPFRIYGSFAPIKNNPEFVNFLVRNGFDITKWEYYPKGDIFDYTSKVGTNKITEAFKKEGYDSAIVDKGGWKTIKRNKELGDVESNSDELIVFEPEQIHILGNKQDIEGFKDFVKNQSKTLASEPELSTKEVIQIVVKGFELIPVKEGFGNVRFKSKKEKASKQLAARINKWLKDKGWDNKVVFAYEAVYGTINPFIKSNNKYSNGYGTKDERIEEKFFKNSNQTTSKAILKTIAKSTHPLASTAEILLRYTDLVNVPIILENNNSIGTLKKEIVYFNKQGEEIKEEIDFIPAGLYNPNTKNISINKDAQFKGLGSEPTIIHEILHSLTSDYINTTDNNIIKELDEILEYLKKNASKISDKYTLLNKDELLVAFFTNSSFIKNLQKLPALGKYNSYKNLWEQLYDYIMNLFGFNSKEKSLYSEVYGLMTNIVHEGAEYQYNKNTALEQFYQDQNNFFNENSEITDEDWDAVWQRAIENSTSSTMIYASSSFETNSKQFTTFYRDALPSEFDRKSRGNFKNREITEQTLNKVIKRLQKIFPDLKVKTISPYELNQEEHSIPINEINSFIKGDVVYLVDGRFTLENKIEELLHPFVHALKDDNPELFERLFQSSVSEFKKEFEFYKSRLGEDVAKEEVVTKALQSKVLQVKSKSLFNEFIDYLKNIFQSIFPFSSNSKKLTSQFSTDLTIEDLADMLINGGYNFRTEYVQNPYYNATEAQKWVENAYNELKNYAVNNQVEKVEDSEGNSYYSRLGKKLRRVTEVAESVVRQFWKGKRQLTEEQESLRDLARDEGSNIHNAIEKIAYKIVNPETGLFRDTPINLGVNDTNLPDGTYKKIENLVLNRLNTYKTLYGSDVRFLFEQVVYNKKKNLAGTVDFIAITPDRKIHIRDWKTTQREKNPYFDETKPESEKNRRYITNSKKPFKIWKRLAWDTQLTEYKEAIAQITNLDSNKDFPVVRIDPILVEYTPDYKAVINISTPSDDYSYSENRQSIPYISRAETLNNDNLKKLFTKIREIARINIEKTALETGRKFKYDYELDEKIEIMIQDFNLFSDFREIYKLHIDTFIEVQKQINQLSQVESIDIDNAQFIMRELQIAKEYLNAIDSLIIGAQEVYGENLDKSILTEREKQNAEKVKQEQDLLDSIKSFSTDHFTLTNKLNNQRIRLLNLYGEHFGIKKLETVEKIVSGFESNLTSSSTPLTKSVGLLYKVMKNIYPKVRTIFRDRKEKLQSLKHELDIWAKQNGKTFKEAMHFFIDLERGRLKSKFHPDFYKDRSEVLQSGDIKRIKAFFQKYYNWNELKAKFDENLKKEIEEIQSANYSYSKKEELEKAIKRKIEYANKKWNLDTSVNAYSYISLDYLNEENPEFQDKYYTEFFKELKKKGNETLYKVYDYFIEINKKTFEAGGIDYNEIYSFIPKIPKSLMEKGLPALNPKEIYKSILESVKLNSNSEFGNVNLVTGEKEKKQFVPYTQDIFAGDYSQMNFDLFATYAEFSEGMETAFHIKEFIPFSNVLLDLEKNKQVLEVSRTGSKLLQSQGDNRGQAIEVTRDDNWKYLEMHIDANVFGKTLQDSFDHVITRTNIVKKKDEEGNEYEEEEVTHYSTIKMLQGVMSWMYKNTFGLNVSTPVRQYIAGIGHQYFTSGRHFIGKEMAENGRLLSKFFDLISSNKDVSDKKALALDYFMPYLDNEYKLQSKELSTNFTTRLFQPENLFFLMRKGTRMTQANIFMTLLDNFIVVDGKVHNVYEYVRKQNLDLYNSTTQDINRLLQEEEKKIQELKRENSIYNNLEIKEKEVDGKVRKYLEIKDLDEQEVIEKVQYLSMYYSKKITGENTTGDYYGYRSKMLARMFAMYRNWIPRTVSARMGKFRVNMDIENYEWGRWGAYMSVLQEAAQENKLQVVKYFFGLSKKEELIQYAKSKLEKIRKDLIDNNREIIDFDSVFSEREFIDMYLNNYKKSVTEFRMITLMMLLLASGAMAPDDDDDAETKALKKFAQFQFDRMQDEFSFYINPKSAVELVGGNLFPGSPYIINVINAVINTGAEALYQMTGNYEKLESNKPLKYWLKSIPVLNQFVLYYTLFEPDIAKDLGVKPFTIRKL